MSVSETAALRARVERFELEADWETSQTMRVCSSEAVAELEGKHEDALGVLKGLLAYWSWVPEPNKAAADDDLRKVMVQAKRVLRENPA